MILLIETATKNCSVALMHDGAVIAEHSETADDFVHAERLHSSIDLLVKKNGGYAELKAIGISKGPGSYTGLRIGVSAAKGLCFGLNIPLLALRTTESLAHFAITQKPEAGKIIAMIDARRNEVYSEQFDIFGNSLAPVQAQIIDEHFVTMLKANTIVVGDGAFKCEGMAEDQAILSILPTAAMMARGAYEKWLRGEVENLAYFEPFYFKEFVPGMTKKFI